MTYVLAGHYPKPCTILPAPVDGIHEGELHQGQEDEGGANEEPDVHELSVGHLRQRVLDSV